MKTAIASGPPACVWFNPAIGVAGDMLLAALLDLGADEAMVLAQLDTLGVDGWSIERTTTRRCGLVATSVTVHTRPERHHRSWSTIDAMLAEAALDPFVCDGARRTFRALAEAEAAVHGIEIDEVHFHEVGAVDAIVDIVGVWAALRSLATGDAPPPEVHAAAIGLGAGTASMSHGRVPVPAPATLELLRGVPSVPVEIDGETATPTGVALLVTMVAHWGAPPAGRIQGTGRGAGSRDVPTHANVVTAVALTDEYAHTGAERVTAVLLETNLDDVTPEVLAHVVHLALVAGADDAWITPIAMKKGRPAHQLSVLCTPSLAPSLRELVCRETGTLGVRQWMLDKHELARRVDEVEVQGQVIGVKVGPHGAKAEHDDVAAAADALDRPLRDVARDALDVWRSTGFLHTGTGSPRHASGREG